MSSRRASHASPCHTHTHVRVPLCTAPHRSASHYNARSALTPFRHAFRHTQAAVEREARAVSALSAAQRVQVAMRPCSRQPRLSAPPVFPIRIEFDRAPSLRPCGTCTDLRRVDRGPTFDSKHGKSARLLPPIAGCRNLSRSRAIISVGSGPLIAPKLLSASAHTRRPSRRRAPTFPR